MNRASAPLWPHSEAVRVIVVSGVSGAGKTVALRALEDNGFIALDNLPVPFLVPVVTHIARNAFQADPTSAALPTGIAVAVDVRSGNLEALPAACAALTDVLGLAPQVIFLDARDEVLLARFSETRRSHPLARGAMPLAEALAAERALLAPLSETAHRIDTSHLPAAQLRRWLIEWLSAPTGGKLVVTLQSFGFKHGVPLDADLLFDVRCLPNPHYDPELQPLTGRDALVQAFLAKEPLVTEMIEAIATFLRTWLPRYRAEPRAYLTVAIGCTGGQHRSVYLVETLAAQLADLAHIVIRHRALAQRTTTS